MAMAPQEDEETSVQVEGYNEYEANYDMQSLMNEIEQLEGIPDAEVELEGNDQVDELKQNASTMQVSDGDSHTTSTVDESITTEYSMRLKEQLKNFETIAAIGQLFLKYTGKRRRKPQDRIVKVSFDTQSKPMLISWGSGSRHLNFSEIQYIAWGHWTPVFEARKDELDPRLCFSVVGKQQILDVQAQSKEMAELWVKGLRKLIGHSDEKSDKLAKQAMESGNLPGFAKNKGTAEAKRAEREHKKRTKSLKMLQKDLFVMTTTTVFRNLEEERIWDIDQSVRERFTADSLYEEALEENIQWRQWNHWVRERIVTYLRENNRIAKPPQYATATDDGLRKKKKRRSVKPTSPNKNVQRTQKANMNTAKEENDKDCCIM